MFYLATALNLDFQTTSLHLVDGITGTHASYIGRYRQIIVTLRLWFTLVDTKLLSTILAAPELPPLTSGMATEFSS